MATAAEYKSAYARLYPGQTLTDASAAALAASDSGAGYSTTQFQAWDQQQANSGATLNGVGAIMSIWNGEIGYLPSASDLASQTSTMNGIVAQQQAAGQSSVSALNIAYRAMGASLANSTFTPTGATASLGATFAANWGMNTSTLSGQQAFVTQAFQTYFGRTPTADELNANVKSFQIVQAAYKTAPVTELTTDARAKGDFLADFQKQAVDFSLSQQAKGLAPLPEVASVENAVFDVGNNTYNGGPGQTLSTQPGAVSSGPVINLTQNVDFGPNFTTGLPNAVFNAYPVTNAFGTVLNTLNTADNLQDLVGDGTFNQITTAGVVAGVTMNGIKTANILNTVASGFNGTITGLTTVNIQGGSAGGETLGVAGNGLRTALSAINLGANEAFTAVMTPTALSGAADAVTVTTTVAYGAKGAPVVVDLTTDNNPGGTTAVNGYETINVVGNAATFMQLGAGAEGTMSTKALTVGGTGAVTLGAGAAATYSKIATIDASGNSGGVNITGLANVNSDGTVSGATSGLLAADTSLTSFKGGSGADMIDLSNLTAAQVAAVTTLDGAGGRDTLLVSAAVANGQISTATSLAETNFEILGVGTGLGGTVVDFTKLGAGIDTVALYGLTGGAVQINNAPGTFTYAAANNENANALTINAPAGNTATTDVLNITESNTGATGTFGAITVTGYETINDTVSGAIAQTHGAFAATPSPGAVTTYDLVDSLTGGVTLTLGGVNVGAGSINISGAATGAITLGVVTAGLLNASGETGLTGAAGITMTNATGAISIVGSGGADVLVGSNAADVISGGGGADTIANMTTAAGGGSGLASADSLTGGAGSDAFILRGDKAVGATLAADLAATAVINDFTVGTTTANSDSLNLSFTAATNYVNGGAVGFTASVAAGAPGATVVQTVSPNVPGQAVLAGADMLKLNSFTEAAGMTSQTAFNAAIGAATVTGLTATKDIFFMMYDATVGQAIVGLVNDGAGTATVVESGDVVTVIGHIAMSATDYNNFSGTHLGILAA